MKKCNKCGKNQPWFCYLLRYGPVELTSNICLDCLEEAERAYNKSEAIKCAIVDGFVKWFEIPLSKKPFFTTEMLKSATECIHKEVIRAVKDESSK